MPLQEGTVDRPTVRLEIVGKSSGGEKSSLPNVDIRNIQT